MNIYYSKFSGDTIDAILGNSIGPAQSIANNTYLNSIVKQGLYYSQNTAVTNTLHDLPSGLTGGFMLLVYVVGSTSNVIHQVIIPNNDGAFYLRKSFDTGSTFLAWYKANTYAATYPTRGTTSERVAPTAGGARGIVGDMFFDTTLKKPTFYVGNLKDANDQIISSTGWVDANGTPV